MSELNVTLASFTDVLQNDINESQTSQPISLSSKSNDDLMQRNDDLIPLAKDITERGQEVSRPRPRPRPAKGTGQHGEFRSIEEIDPKYRCIFTYPYFNLVQSKVIEDALYSDKSMVVCAPTGSGKTVVFEMAITQLLMEMDDKNYEGDFKIIYMAPVKAVCTERLTEWYPKLTQLGLLCIEVTGDTEVDFSQLKPYRVIITTPEKWDMLTRRWTDYRGLVEVIKLFLIDEVHILNDETRGPVLEAVVSRMKAIESSSQSAYRIERLQKQYQEGGGSTDVLKADEPPKIRFVAVSATVSNPEDVAAWLGNGDRHAIYFKIGDECRPVKLQRVVEGYPCPEGTSIFKFDIILNYKLWPIIQKYYNGKPTLIFCNTRKSVFLTAEALAREVTVTFSPEQKAKLTALASTVKTKKLQMLIMSGIGCHHAGLLFEERMNIERAFRHRELPILITTTTLAMGVNLPAHLVIIKNTQQYVKGAYQEYSISTVLQMVGRAGRPQYDTTATAVIMTRAQDKARYQSLVGGSEPLQSYLHKRLAENLNCEAALHTVTDVAQCVQWLRSTFLYVRAAKDPKRYLGLSCNAPQHLIMKKIEELCVKAMNGLASSGLISMDEASCIESTDAGRLMSLYYLDFETMKKIMTISGSESLEQLLWIVCESHELSDMHLRMDERRSLNALNRNNAAATIRYPMKGKITTRQMKSNCIIQAVLGCLPIADPSLTQEAMKIMRIAERICKCMVAYVTRPDIISGHTKFYSAVINAVLLEKCMLAHLWENSPYLSKQLKGIGPTFSTLLATAGKVTVMQLEESHPRDLERIMNKGPPAGNVLHKQITLLPKYQITITPIDEKSVTIQLLLLNQHFLMDNIEQLTAGAYHRCCLIVGDTENYILHCSSFFDKNLIQMYDGIITLKIERLHRFEHKILAHCISASFVGVDVNCEYLFKDLDEGIPAILPNAIASFYQETPNKLSATKQTSIKDTFKERKRKSSTVSQANEKKKRDNSAINKFMDLNRTFSNNMKYNNNEKSNNASSINPITNENDSFHCFDSDFSESFNEPYKNIESNDKINETFNSEVEIVDDYQIDSILNEIESEINRKSGSNDFLPDIVLDSRKIPSQSKKETPYLVQNNNVKPALVKQSIHNNRIHKASTSKKVDNFKFIELIEKNTESNDHDKNIDSAKSGGFSKAIQDEIKKFLNKAATNIPPNHSINEELLASPNESMKSTLDLHEPSDIKYEVPIKNSPVNDVATVIKSLSLDSNENYPHNEAIYEISSDNASTETFIIEELNNANSIDTQNIPKKTTANKSFEINKTEEDTNGIDTDGNPYSYNGDKIETIVGKEYKNTFGTPCINLIANNYKTNMSNDISSEEMLENAGEVTQCNDKTPPTALVVKKLRQNSKADVNNQLDLRSKEVLQACLVPQCSNETNGKLETSMVAMGPQTLFESSKATSTDISKENSLNSHKKYLMSLTMPRIERAVNDKFQDQKSFKSSQSKAEYKNEDSSSKYSYEAQRVDILEKISENKRCTIKVVQNIKIDLDVTNTEKINNDKKIKPLSNSALRELTPILPNQRLKINNNNDGNKLYDKQSVFAQLKAVNLTDKIVLHKKSVNNNPAPIENTLRCIVTDNATRNELNKENTNCYHDGVINFNSIKTQKSNNKYPDTKDTVEDPKNAINKVLQKYANIFKQKTDPGAVKELFKGPTKNNEVRQNVSQRKLFKIKDIQHIDVDLTKVLDSDVVTPINYPIMPTNNNNKSDSKETIESCNVKTFAKDKVTVNRPVIQPCFKNEAEYTVARDESPSPPPASGYVTDDNEQGCNVVDQSMLNPRTLLQTFRDEDNSFSVPLVLPPPPGFDDDEDVSYSPPPSDTQLDAVRDMQESMDREFQYSESPEVETWNLSSREERLSYSSRLSQNYDSQESMSFQRTPLNNFKYKPKCKIGKRRF